MSFDQKMAQILPGSAVSIDSPYFRNSDGTVHGAIDFNFTNGNLNIFDGPNVYSPVSGTLAKRAEKDVWGEVVIQAQDGTYHRILHLHQIDAALLAAEVGTPISAGQLLGTMGGRGEWQPENKVKRPDGSTVPGNYLKQAVLDGSTSGFDAYHPHVHYEIYLPDEKDASETISWSKNDLRIDPQKYWDLDPEGGLKLTTSFTNVSLTEGGAGAIVAVEVNTPHAARPASVKGALTLKVTLTSNAAAGQVQILGNPRTALSPTIASRDPLNPNVYYLTLPSTRNIAKTNDVATFVVVAQKDTDLNAITGSLRVEAGYLKSDGTWVSYQNFLAIDAIGFQAGDPDFDANLYLQYAGAGETQSTWFSSTPHTVIDAHGQTGALQIAAVGDLGEVYGGDSNNILYGNDFANYLRNGEGDDELYGYGGDDFLVATGGADKLVGGRKGGQAWYIA